MHSSSTTKTSHCGAQSWHCENTRVGRINRASPQQIWHKISDIDILHPAFYSRWDWDHGDNLPAALNAPLKILSNMFPSILGCIWTNFTWGANQANAMLKSRKSQDSTHVLQRDAGGLKNVDAVTTSHPQKCYYISASQRIQLHCMQACTHWLITSLAFRDLQIVHIHQSNPEEEVGFNWSAN